MGKITIKNDNVKTMMDVIIGALNVYTIDFTKSVDDYLFRSSSDNVGKIMDNYKLNDMCIFHYDLSDEDRKLNEEKSISNRPMLVVIYKTVGNWDRGKELRRDSVENFEVNPYETLYDYAINYAFDHCCPEGLTSCSDNEVGIGDIIKSQRSVGVKDIDFLIEVLKNLNDAFELSVYTKKTDNGYDLLCDDDWFDNGKSKAHLNKVF